MTRRRATLLATLLMAVALLVATPPAPAAVDPLPDPPEPNPADPVDYVAWLNEVTGAEGNAGAAAWKQAGEALDKYCEEHGDWDHDKWGPAMRRPWSDDEFPELAKWLEGAQPAMDLFRKAAMMENVRFPRRADGAPAPSQRFAGSVIQITTKYLAEYRTMARALVAEACQRDGTGPRGAKMVENMAIVLRASHTLGEAGFLIEWLVGAAMRALAYDALIREVDLSDDRAATAATVLAMLREHDRSYPDMANGIVFSRVGAIDLVQRMFIRPHGEQWVVDRRVFTWIRSMGSDAADEAALPEDKAYVAMPASYEEVLRRLRRYYDALDEAAEAGGLVGLYKARAVDQQLEAATEAHPDDLNETIAQIVTSGFDRAFVVALRDTASRRATWVTMFLHKYKAEHGEFPEKLTDVPELKEKRLGRQDPFSGQDFAYRRDGDDFILYSWDGNLKDDGGKHVNDVDEGDRVYWPVQHPEKEGEK